MNTRPSAPKADALPDCATPRIIDRLGFDELSVPEKQAENRNNGDARHSLLRLDGMAEQEIQLASLRCKRHDAKHYKSQNAVKSLEKPD